MIHLLIKSEAHLELQDDQGRTPLTLAIEKGHVLGEGSAAAVLLSVGAKLAPEMWDCLLILALDQDFVVYPRIAFDRGVYLHNIDDETKFSLHKAVSCGAVKIMRFMKEAFGSHSLKRIALTPDSKGFSAVDYAKVSGRKEVLRTLAVVMGEEKETEEEKSIDKASHLGSSGLRVGDTKKEAVHLEEGKFDNLGKQRSVARASHEQGTSPSTEDNLIGGTRGKQKT